MPIYEYKCDKCSEVREVILPVGVNKNLTCTKCGGTMERVPSVPSIHFKGSGWTQKGKSAPSCSLGCDSCGGDDE